MEPIGLQTMLDQVSKSITDLRSDIKLPEAKIQYFMQLADVMLRNIQRYSTCLIKSFLLSRGILFSEEDVVNLINELHVPSVFTDVKYLEDNLAFLAYISKCAIPVPKGIELGFQKVTRSVPLGLRKGMKMSTRVKIEQSVSRVTRIRDMAYYIPVIETLRLVMNNPDARAMIHKELPQNDKSICSFKDGSQFKSHPFLNKYPFALRLSLHLDDVEYLNPLGSRRIKKKMTMFSIRIQNIHSTLNASLDRIYLVMVVQSKLLKKYGYGKILRPFIDDLKKLQTDDGVLVELIPRHYVLRAVLIDVLGDSLAVHDIFELLSPSAKFFCRSCYITRDALVNGELGDIHPLRTEESLNENLKNLKSGTITPSECGIVKECVLHELDSFNIANNWSFDPMHDLLEGVVSLILKAILRDALTEKLITEKQINEYIERFEFRDAEIRDKPSANFTKESIKSSKNILNQSAAQTWTLLRAFPFIFWDLIQHKECYQVLISTLLRITYFSFSSKMTLDMLEELRKSIEIFHKTFVESRIANMINKIHHISHYVQKILEKGPSVFDSCMLFEGKFRDRKGQAKTCNNFKNLSYSLAKRHNFKQVHNITNHQYDTNSKTVLKSYTTQKTDLEFSSLLFDLSDEVTVIQSFTSNLIHFSSGLIVKYINCALKCYGIILSIIDSGEEYIFLIQALEIIEFCYTINAYKTKITKNILRIPKSKVFKRKTYSLWTTNNTVDKFLYISLKYFDE
ncbi:uncharacterized protein LOC131426952 [Malaya genurostris]|uniref:uncharacterized protein LOC131426952 n=1 Tax=Malaya genurostris TaxID=325434 RepID=UPI0026F3A609|nr:uncharacterized protein LOC131426952 [Malaya genurostris]